VKTRKSQKIREFFLVFCSIGFHSSILLILMRCLLLQVAPVRPVALSPSIIMVVLNDGRVISKLIFCRF
jgi:hypothetical protein